MEKEKSHARKKRKKKKSYRDKRKRNIKFKYELNVDNEDIKEDKVFKKKIKKLQSLIWNDVLVK